MTSKLYLSGAVDKDGKLRVFEKNELEHFLKQNTGKRIVIQVEASDQQRKASFIAYYYKVVIPKIRAAYIHNGILMSKEGVEVEMRKRCLLYEEVPKADGTGYDKRLRGLSELNDTELYEYIELLKIMTGEFMHIYIDDPITF